jgi:hypothetical protein
MKIYLFIDKFEKMETLFRERGKKDKRRNPA